MQNKINININNFGPINKADIDINRINVIGGVNSSGKSFSSKLLFCFLTAVSKQGDKIDNNSVRELFENFINNHAGHFSFNEDSSGNGFPLNQKLISLMDNWDPNSIDFKFLNNFFIKFKDILEDYDILNDEICKNELSNIQNIIEKHEKPFNHVQNVLNFLISIEFQGNSLNNTCINFNGNVNDYNYEFLFKNDKQEIKIKKPNVNTVNFHNVLYIDSLATLDNRMRFDNNRLIKVIEDPFHSVYLFEALVNNLNAQKLYETPDDSKLKSLNEDIRKLLGGYFKFDNESLKFVFNQNNQNYNILNIASGYKQIGIVQLLLSNKQLSKNTILFIDEPEINLHPSMQIRFAELLVKISKELGVIMYINSHSPYFIESIEVFSTKYKFKDEVNFYLTEKMENDKFNFKPISFKNIYEFYNNLSDPYDELDEIRGKNIANHL